MMDKEFIPFFIKAKRNTYASGRTANASSRPDSHDLDFSEGDFTYIDTYLGGFYFIGEEAVWHQGKPVWGMNYYGKMLTEVIPAGFSEFLRAALMQVPSEMPYRGPAQFSKGSFSYRCRAEGEPIRFTGEEEILLDGEPIYWLAFHGGEIKD